MIGVEGAHRQRLIRLHFHFRLLTHQQPPHQVILRPLNIGTALYRHLSYFATNDEHPFEGLLAYLGEDNPEREVFEAIEEHFKDVPRNPLLTWQHPALDDEVKDLISRLCRLDPRERITAKEALEHRWWTEGMDVDQ
jgi:serine/threonine protein kinase